MLLQTNVLITIFFNMDGNYIHQYEMSELNRHS